MASIEDMRKLAYRTSYNAERIALGTALRSYIGRQPEMAEDRQEFLAVVNKYITSGYKGLSETEIEQLNFLIDELKQ